MAYTVTVMQSEMWDLFSELSVKIIQIQRVKCSKHLSSIVTFTKFFQTFMRFTLSQVFGSKL